ncbi:energy-coupling factor transporter transmembrane protein EcfT [Clostridium sp. 'deep sea']|uniref:energy-coupling factor transporter transmembrane component T family protein n=1 Tax=Clostridium sp. 'deep sea' TaxID=2779445 RepID=UPI0018968E08|nr:energy-coupling factor transporter transmembrane component T [Clostridium sp. 'deep sea']QOR34608.1 energy-coupling factor transporter transmembrane protein EcfT [Clostridium sp. 'deep sea']
MLNNITIGQYIPGNSAVHKIDPRVKILLTIFFVVVLFIAKGFYSYLTIALFTMAIIAISRVGIKVILKGLKPLVIIIGLTVILHALFNKNGELLWSIGPLKIYSEGLYFGLLMASRLILLITFTSLLTLTTSPIALTDGIERLLSPFKRIGLPAHELAMMMTIALRFIPTLLEEAQKIMKAQQSRGADFETGKLVERAKALIPLLVPLFVSAFRRADDLAMAMEARCYQGGEGRTRMKILKLRFIDFVSFAVMIALCTLILYLKSYAI